jgi:Ca-activated chloride channel homolog
MNFLTPLALLIGLLAIPIILLYMLRLRRREVSVSSTYLWQQVLRDREANTPWQRLRRNLLLFLQLLILLLLALALARPYITVPAVSAGQIALLLDASASMNATDSADGTRFAEAQRQANAIIDTMSAGDTMTIIRVADVPEVLTGYSSDPALLHAAVDGSRAGSAPADWTAAFTLAAAGAAGASEFNVVVIGDGGIGTAADFPPIPSDIEFVPIGTTGDNLAITALAARALPGEPAQLFAEITNYSGTATEAIFALTIDGTLVSAERYTISARSSLPVVTTSLPAQYESIEASLTLPGESAFVDYLALDNTAYAVSPGASVRRVLLMSDGNRFLEQGLGSLPGINAVQRATVRDLPADSYDVVVLDGWLPPQLPAGDLLIINPPSSTPLFTVGEVTTDTGNMRVERGDPRMTYVDFDAVNLLEFRQVQADWAQPLIVADGGALLLAGEIDGRQVAILTFDVRDSDLPLQITFPILLSSLLTWFTPQDVISEPSIRVGDTVPLRPPLDAQAIRVTLPDGAERALPLSASPIFAETTQPGCADCKWIAPTTRSRARYSPLTCSRPSKATLRRARR